MNSVRLSSQIFVFALISSIFLATPRAGGSQDLPLRPQIVVTDAASGCPSVKGSFVALLNSTKGILLLSAAPFPGGQFAGDARGSEMTVSVPGTEWPLDRISSRQGQTPIWAARYPSLAAGGRGCVSFDKQFWSSEGDLVTYMRWLVEEVYLELPPEERQRQPDLHIADREVSLRVERPGYGPFHLTGKEGATLACRYQDGDRVYLLIPFVLHEATGRVAVKVAFTDGSYFDTSTKIPLGWVMTSPEDPGVLSDPPLTIAVEGVFQGDY